MQYLFLPEEDYIFLEGKDLPLEDALLHLEEKDLLLVEENLFILGEEHLPVLEEDQMSKEIETC